MRVLIVITTEFVPYGGLTTVVMNYYRTIEKKDIEIDIASTNAAPTELCLELSKHGSHYYNLGNRKSPIRYIKNLFHLLKKGYDIIHVNGNSATMLLELLPAKCMEVPLRIAHVHTTKTEHPIMHRLIYPWFKLSYNRAISVSDKAGQWLFGRDYLVLNNAIDVNKYSYSQGTRQTIRKSIGLSESTFVLGNVGKLNASKNHAFLLDVFSELKKKTADAKLIIVGGGPLEYELKQRVEQLKIQRDVVFTGMLDDTSDYLQAFDFFVFPSVYEGLGLALIEAQASGLKCVISDCVPKEAIVSNQVKQLSLKDTTEEWADYIYMNRQYDRVKNSKDAARSIKQHGFDISTEARKLRSIYMNQVG